jgi:hypothetical protein
MSPRLPKNTERLAVPGVQARTAVLPVRIPAARDQRGNGRKAERRSDDGRSEYESRRL